jgi:hypothetical protein
VATAPIPVNPLSSFVPEKLSGYEACGPPPPFVAPLVPRCALTDMEVRRQGVGGRRMWVGSAARGRGQDGATVITLIFAGQRSRCRMTVSRHRGIHPTSRTWVETTSECTWVLGNLCQPRPRAAPSTHAVHAVADTSWNRWPAAQMKPASSRAMAVSALSVPMRKLRWR